MALGDFLNPATFTTGSLPVSDPIAGMPSLASVDYDLDIPNEIGLTSFLEREFLNAKSKVLPPWLRIAFPTNNPKNELGNIIKPAEPGDGVHYEKSSYLNIQSLATDWARPSRYEVMFFVPIAVPFDANVQEYMPSVVGAVLPGKSLTTMDDRHGGPNMIKKPFDVTYDDVTITFQVSDTMLEHDLISKWIDYQFDNKTKTFRFMDDYVTDISITQFDNQRNIVKTVKLLKAHPILMSEISLGYDMVDVIETFTVTFAYESWIEV